MIRRVLPLAFALAWPALAAAQVPPVPPAPPAEDHSRHQMPAPPVEDHSAHQAPPPAVVLPPFIPPLTAADRAAAFPDVHDTMAHDDNALNYFVLFDQLEWQSGDDDALSWDTKGWVGRDRDRLWFRAEGERDGGGRAGAKSVTVVQVGAPLAGSTNRRPHSLGPSPGARLSSRTSLPSGSSSRDSARP